MKCDNCNNIFNNDLMYCPLCGSSNVRVIDNNINNSNTININNTYSYIDNTTNNKKNNKTLITIIILSIISILIGIFAIINSNNKLRKYELISAKSFSSYMESINYKVVDLTKSYANQKYIKEYFTASSGNKSIIYINLDKEDKSNNLYNSIKKNITNYATSQEDIITNIENNNINKYIINNGKKYAILVKVDNMIIYTITETKYINEIDDIFNNLGYKTSSYKSNTFYFIISISIMLVVYTYSLYKLFIKFGEKGIYSIIPIYNLYILSKKVLGNGIFLIVFLIPIINILFILYFNIKLAKIFNKSILFSILLILFNFIFFPILALDKNDYMGMKLL